MKSSRLHIFTALIVGLFAATQAHAQATLSTQGVLQRTTGMAVEDGDYAITFKLYTTESGGTPVWSETQSDVEVVGGVYGVQLGSVTPLNIPFDQVYYLGLTVSGGAEHFPRTKLTAAPYALSLLGQDNKFPSTGAVEVGSSGSSNAVIEFKKGANTASITYDGTNISIPNLTPAAPKVHVLLQDGNTTVTGGPSPTWTNANVPEVLDDQNAYSAGVFTAPHDGIYHVSGLASFNGSIVPGFLAMRIAGTGGLANRAIAYLNINPQAGSSFAWMPVSADIKMTAGQTFTLQVSFGAANLNLSYTLGGPTGFNSITITEY